MAGNGVAGRTLAARSRASGFRCAECGWSTAKWVGRCGECQAWGTVDEVAASAGPRTTSASRVAIPARPIGEVDPESARARPTGVGEFDRVLGGGLVPGGVVLVAGEPGIGKSTLLLDVAARAARGSSEDGTARRVLYVSGEESAAQVRARAERIEAMAASLFLASETDLATVLGQIDQVVPDLVVVDSVQTIASGEVDGAAGNVSQVREVAAALIAAAKSRGMAVLLVGHVTKDGSIAGPRVLEHLVDVVIQFEGDRHSRLRLVRAVKNRYGPTDEIGCFDLSEVGIVGLPDPSGLFTSDRSVTVPGTCMTVALEGRRPLLVEVQSLVASSTLSQPRRATSGLDTARVQMIIAVLERRAKAPIGANDTFVSTVGGVRLTEPAADLAVALAIGSAVVDQPLLPSLIAVGEVGLSGDIRPAVGIGRRLAEAARLGVTHAIVPTGTVGAVSVPTGLHVAEVGDLRAALRAALSAEGVGG
ncbi:DNA repair protein RadA [Nostocoides sp. F2B08]|uniref:DNA repair protein RadA n=1 Tax=Nostocoides sp. F2B08 TaxID=2653936 RepID=UPI0012631881|nr:DNA repair protein RadA [Tetrasphaera sp. F2B08]KAB7746473.1 DNA repair protein RadA [Tetrasphaera sp. F2B08]